MWDYHPRGEGFVPLRTTARMPVNTAQAHFGVSDEGLTGLVLVARASRDRRAGGVEKAADQLHTDAVSGVSTKP